MSVTNEFDVELFEQRLTNLKDTQDCIQQMSAWCLSQRAHHKKIVNSWLTVLKQVRVELRLTLFYLANDVIQYSKRKNYEFVESWGTALQKATTMVRDEKVRTKIFRIFKIWEQREIYSEEYLSDLNGLLSMNPAKKSQPPPSNDPDEFQNSTLVSNIRDCVGLEKKTDRNFKKLPKVPNCDTESIKQSMKDKSHSEDVEKEIDNFVAALEIYVKSLKSEIKSRKSLITNVQQAETFYQNQRGEVKVVVNAYKNFGNRIKVMKRKLDEITPKLPSPIPSPDINAPSPEQDADIVLPDDQINFPTNFFKNSSNGYVSYMDGNLPFDINDFKRDSPSSYDSSSQGTQPIQVINSRTDEKSNSSFELNDYFKPTDSQYTPSRMPLPVPPVSNYPIATSSTDVYSNQSSNYETYNPMNAAYTNDTRYMPNASNSNYDENIPLMPPPPMPPSLGSQNDDFNSSWDMDMPWSSSDPSNSFSHMLDTPVSPPHFEREGLNTNIIEYVDGTNEDMLESVQDVDHRPLHLSATTPFTLSMGKEKGRCVDIDHRNLISLTGSPGPKPSEIHSKISTDCWSPEDKDFRSNSVSSFPHSLNEKADSLDIDYRTSISSDELNESNSLQGPSNPLLEPPMFPQMNKFLSSPSAVFDTSMPPPNFVKLDQVKGKAGLKGNNGNDNVESIDMEMSDEDLEDYSREDLLQQSDTGDSDEFNSGLPGNLQSGFKQPLLQTPDYANSPWDNLQLVRPNMANNGNHNDLSNMWKSPRMLGGPQFRMPNNQQFSRGGFMSSPRMKINYRGSNRSRGGGYYNNRGRGGGRGGPHRGNFRGNSAWQ